MGVDQSRTPVHRQTAGGANGREAPVLSPTSGPRLPPYTMAPKEGPQRSASQIERDSEGNGESGLTRERKCKKGKEMEERMQGTRELTNKEWAGGRERWELEPKPTGAKRRDFLLCSPS